MTRDTIEKLDKRLSKYKNGNKARLELFVLLDSTPGLATNLRRRIESGQLSGMDFRGSLTRCACIYGEATITMRLTRVEAEDFIFAKRKHYGDGKFTFTPLEEFVLEVVGGKLPKENERLRLILRAISLWEAKESPSIIKLS